MFTGITRGTFEVVHVKREPNLLRFAVDLGNYGAGLQLGASVSIDGVCQTVVRTEGSVVHFDAITETLDKTTLGRLEVGRRVSVERSARVGDEIGGHDVSGHVRGRGRVEEVRRDGHDVELTIAVDPGWMKYISPKGFIAIDGSSLTVGETDATGRFTLYLIPETLRLTNFHRRQVGDEVNVELDARSVTIVDTVEQTVVQTVERILAERGLLDR